MAVNSLQQAYQTQTDELKPLLHELQLGEKLNECVHQTRRADFSLMLAMLADDVREQSQFILPQSESLEKNATDNHALRQLFDLPEQAPLSLKSMDDISHFNQAKHVENEDLASIHLANAISPFALAFRDDVKHVPTEVISNTSVHCQIKHKSQRGEQSENRVNKPLNFNAQAWLKGIEKSLITAPLIS